MPVREVVGNLFDGRVQTLVNTVNTRGVMGKGLALEFKNRFPEMYEDYRQRCARGEVQTGKPYLYTGSRPWIVNFPTKDHWRYPSRMNWIREGLDYFAEHYHEWGVTSIAFPQLGTQNGGLSWSDVRSVMIDALAPLDLVTVIYVYGADTDAGLDWLNRATTAEIVFCLGLKSSLASSIVERRQTIGGFSRREQLLDVPKLGPKTYSRLVPLLEAAEGEHQPSLL